MRIFVVNSIEICKNIVLLFSNIYAIINVFSIFKIFDFGLCSRIHNQFSLVIDQSAVFFQRRRNYWKL